MASLPPPLPGSAAPSSEAGVVHIIRDAQHGNMPVAALRFPPGWRARSAVHWNYQNYSFPVLITLQAQDPTGAVRFEMFPSEAFCWIEPAYAVMGFQQPGQSAFGQTTWQPVPGPQALAGMLIPKYRGRAPGLRVTSAGADPDLTRVLGTADRSACGVRATATYQGPAGPIREDFFAIHSQNSAPNYGPQGMLTQINWGFLYIHSYTASAATFDRHAPALRAASLSLKMHPGWAKLLTQILQQLQTQFNALLQQGYSQIQAAVQTSHAISANNDAMLSMIEHQRLHSWSPTPSHDSSRAFSNMMRGEETYEDPYWGESQQSNLYDYVWTDGQGNYQQSNDAGYDPNVGGTMNWQLIQRKG